MATVVNPADGSLQATTPRLITVSLANNLLFSGNVTGTVNGVAASDITGAINNFNTSNDQNSTAIPAPTVGTTSHTANDDGAVNVKFTWTWTGTEASIDGFILYSLSRTSNVVYTFTDTAQADEVLAVLPASRRAHTLYGVPATLYYSFGIRAYRRVNTSVATSGIIFSSLVQTTANPPYRPSSVVNLGSSININSAPLGSYLNSNVSLSGTNGTLQLSGGTGSVTGIVMPGFKINSTRAPDYLEANAIGSTYISNLAADKITAGTITALVTIRSGQGAAVNINSPLSYVQLGKVGPAPDTHFGISLSDQNYDNCFVRRTDGHVFLNLSTPNYYFSFNSISGLSVTTPQLTINGGNASFSGTLTAANMVSTNNITPANVSATSSAASAGASVIVGFNVDAGATGIIVDEYLGPATRTETSGCFAAGTLISTPMGKVAIETLKPNDLIYAFDNYTREIKLQKVKKLFIHDWKDVGQSSPLIKVIHETGTVSITKNHLVYSDEKGNTQENNKYIAIEELMVGDYLTLENAAKSRILKIEPMPVYDKVYNLEVTEHHNFIADGIRVHNNQDTSGQITGKIGTTVIGPVLNGRRLFGPGQDNVNGTQISNVKLGLAAGYYELLVGRTYYAASTMTARVVVLRR